MARFLDFVLVTLGMVLVFGVPVIIIRAFNTGEKTSKKKRRP